MLPMLLLPLLACPTPAPAPTPVEGGVNAPYDLEAEPCPGRRVNLPTPPSPPTPPPPPPTTPTSDEAKR